MSADPTTAPGVVDTVTAQFGTVGAVLLTVLGAALLVAAGVWALRRGWWLFSGLLGGGRHAAGPGRSSFGGGWEDYGDE
jgi:hypothetical protein